MKTTTILIRSWLAGIFCVGIVFQARASEKLTDSIPAAEILERSRQVDDLVQAGYNEHNVLPNPISSDEVFLRRVFLAVIGRIPTYDEATRFLDSDQSDKRSHLIDRLLDSEGYVSHLFNYWADLLRIQSRLRNAPAQPYIDWVKDSIRNNKPYDQFVEELITAEGYIWDNGASGYHLRDAGMPLDHMANTFQVFMGTQLVCAQCHDHPYDEWTQLDYYQQAAFMGGVKTSDSSVNRKFRALGRGSENKQISPEVRVAARRLVRPLRYKVNETNARLRLPDDYQYDDATPKSVVKATTIFGDEIKVTPGESRRDAYAEWFTSPDNPRFALVIANRLWKELMGIGLIEPVDDLSDSFDASNPQLMQYLADLVVDLDFDLKQYQRVLLNTQVYQRAVHPKESDPNEPYYFPGPILQRMSAEQMWDSVTGLVVPYLDLRKGEQRQDGRYSMAKHLVDKDVNEIVKIAEQTAYGDKQRRAYRSRSQALQKTIREAQESGNQQRLQQARRQLAQLRRQSMANANRMQGGQYSRRSTTNQSGGRWRGYSSQLVRASEIQSPARPGHFLRQFGQSDRETIENSNTEANVPQVLTLLNGPIYEALKKKNALLYRDISRARTPAEQLDVIYLSLLTRRPTTDEAALLLPEIESRRQNGCDDVIWAVLNTREFAFVQ